MVLLLVAVGGVLAISVARGPSGGLVPVDEENVGFALRCGDTVTWDAAVVANSSKTPLVVKSARLLDPPPGFSIAYARGWFGRREASADDGRARTPLTGIRIERTPPSHVPAWHVLIGIRTPTCRPPLRQQRKKVSDGPSWTKIGKALVVSYSIGGDNRSVRLGGGLAICTAPSHYRCRLPEPLP